MKSFVVLFLSLLVLNSSLSAVDSLLKAPKRGSSSWGHDDQRGAINQVSPETILEALRLIKKGIIIPLGRNYEESMPQVSGRTYTLLIPEAAPPAGKYGAVAHEEFVATQLGQVGTQLDGLGHVGIGDVFYNGFDRREFATPKGLTKLGIENVGVFLTRGVLLDIALLKGKARLDKGYEITDRDLKLASKNQRLEIRRGDAVFVHTGWGALWNVDNELYTSGEPGIGVSAANFLAERGIILVGADNWALDVRPSADPELLYPAHPILVTKNGIYILENLDTSMLARDKVHEFVFFFAPLRLKGATGSPGNPVAIY